jgi:glutaconate CoA-transferase subunit A
MNRADASGNAQFLGPDPFFDDLFLGAAEKRFVSCEKIVPTAELQPLHTLRISRLSVDGVVEAPGGAWFTDCAPDYPRDEALQREYAESAASPEKWRQFRERHLG